MNVDYERERSPVSLVGLTVYRLDLVCELLVADLYRLFSLVAEYKKNLVSEMY